MPSSASAERRLRRRAGEERAGRRGRDDVALALVELRALLGRRRGFLDRRREPRRVPPARSPCRFRSSVSRVSSMPDRASASAPAASPFRTRTFARADLDRTFGATATPASACSAAGTRASASASRSWASSASISRLAAFDSVSWSPTARALSYARRSAVSAASGSPASSSTRPSATSAYLTVRMSSPSRSRLAMLESISARASSKRPRMASSWASDSKHAASAAPSPPSPARSSSQRAMASSTRRGPCAACQKSHQWSSSSWKRLSARRA